MEKSFPNKKFSKRRKKALKGKSKQMGNFNHCCCRTVSLLQIKITGNENLLTSFP